jgi:hypothetical protein
MRFAQREKKKARRTSRPYVLEVFQDSVAYLGSQWKFLNPLVLQPSEAELFIGPVHVIQS